MFSFVTRPVDPEPAITLEQVMQESVQHEELIAKIKAEIAEEGETTGVPDQLFPQ